MRCDFGERPGGGCLVVARYAITRTTPKGPRATLYACGPHAVEAAEVGTPNEAQYNVRDAREEAA